MNAPKCCGRPAKPFVKRYASRGVVHSIAAGFACAVCGHVGVPFVKAFDRSYMDAMDAVRIEGMEFDRHIFAAFGGSSESALSWLLGKSKKGEI